MSVSTDAGGIEPRGSPVSPRARAHADEGESAAVEARDADLRIGDTTVFAGPSVLAREPVIVVRLVGATEAGSDLVVALLNLLPGLARQRGVCELPGLLARAGAHAPLPHLFEHAAIELQNLGGMDLTCVRRGTASRWPEALIPYEDARVGLRSAELALELFRALSGSPETSDKPFDFPTCRDEFTEFTRLAALSVQDRALVAAARARGIPVSRIAGRVVRLGYGRFQQRIYGTETSRTNVVSNYLAANKDYARRVLGELGLPIPRYERVYGARWAGEAATRIGFPVVVKPNNSNMGQGVTIGVRSAREARAAYRRARDFGRSALVEQFVPGADFRMLVVGRQLVAAAQRIPAHVVGDGVRTIEALVDDVNSDPRRGSGQQQAWTRLPLDERSDRLLGERGYARYSVPDQDDVVYLRRNANTSDGGTAVDVTDEVHPDNRAIAIRAAQAMGLDVAGVDLLTTDISRSMWDTGGIICEINSKPGVRKHMWPARGRPRDVATPIMEMLFPAGEPVRPPIATLVDPHADSPTAHLLAHILRTAGKAVGLASSTSAAIDGCRTPSPGGYAAARLVLLDPSVEVAVLAMTPHDLMANGLPCEASDVSAIVDANPARDGQPDAWQKLLADTAHAPLLLGRSEDRGSRSGGADVRLATALAEALGVEPGVVRRGIEGFVSAGG